MQHSLGVEDDVASMNVFEIAKAKLDSSKLLHEILIGLFRRIIGWLIADQPDLY